MRSESFPKTILLSGLLVGTLDAAAAIINYCIPTVRNPVRIFQYIASGVFGMNAFSDGVIMPIMGLIFHYFIATSWTLLFFLLYPKINWLSRNWVISGFGYGIFVWLAMNLVILRLSRVPQFPFNATQVAIGMAILMLAIGLPISFFAQRYYGSNLKICPKEFFGEN